MPDRRDFLASVAATAVAGSARPAQPVAERLNVDALCYDPELSEEKISRAIAGGLNVAVFDLALSPRDYESAVRELARWTDRFASAGSRVVCVRRAEDAPAALREGRLGVILACQDASILGSPFGDYEATLSMFHSLGLRVLQLTHNLRTHWGDSFMEKRDGGLSRAGADLVVAMNRLGMLVDLSHCSRLTLLDAVAVSAKPCVVTHAGCAALAPTARNKSDEEILALGASGGFFGVFDMTTWLTDKPKASLETVLDHVDHAARLIGADHIGFGSDGALDSLDAAAEVARMAGVQRANAGGPSAEWPVVHVRVPELNAPNRLQALATGLARRGYTSDQIDGIVGGNFMRVFRASSG